MHTYQSFIYKDAIYKISSARFDCVTAAIVEQRQKLEKYIDVHPEFLTSLVPIDLHDNAPEIAIRMAEAARRTFVGPMAAVAGAMAEAAVREALKDGDESAIVENGGDIFCASRTDVYIGLYPGEGPLGDKLAFAVKPEMMPISICSSSSTMGHSLSFGNCELATVISKSGALADAAATFVCNSVKKIIDMEPTLEKAMMIEGVLGVLIVKSGRIGLAGQLPSIVRNYDSTLGDKVTRFPS
jgi:ApbE superfamily uncharacterized protein (UPF0280 family)